MPGSGLGLAIVKQVVLKHGGALRVEDTVPGGRPPGTSILLWLSGHPVDPMATGHPEPGRAAESWEISSVNPSVISVDSQSMGAR
jgi:two-component system sensor histidine kinase MprB